ncbi:MULTISPECIES: SsrA-binding protein [unclassified Mycoplasma]|uniref:SsrA-binding protein n=1 Tax=unclassified Mycoplasma TaxID=2683645 RepID=UPI002B1E7170|nr:MULTISPECIES: SsrA-binding protein [unclassified Mycoplasma]MEA4134543.1 SsrA-binding protein [Mycoplasma sp. 2704]MEA4276497.1 SsrA-binding protein [Mycoplasma sp. 21DD0573]
MKIISTNKKAHHNYEIIDKYEAGIELLGWEVKSARANSIDISNAFCSIYKGEMYLKEAYFKQYMHVKADEFRDRKLLLHKNEIRKIKFATESQSLTIIPLKMYFNSSSRIKVEIALAKGLKKYDKRQQIIKDEVNKKLNKLINSYK